MKQAEKIYQEMISLGKTWVEEKAKLLKSLNGFPVLPNGKKGLAVGSSMSYYYYKVLLPDGRLAWFHHLTWRFVSFVPDHLYISESTLKEVETAADKQLQALSSQAPQKRFRLSFLKV